MSVGLAFVLGIVAGAGMTHLAYLLMWASRRRRRFATGVYRVQPRRRY